MLDMPKKETEVTEPKPRRTAQEKAQEALDTAERKVARAVKRKKEAQKTMSTIDAEIARLEKERDYLAAHPALTTQVLSEQFEMTEPDLSPSVDPEMTEMAEV